MAESTNKGGRPEKPVKSTSPGVIRADELYTLEEVRLRLKLGSWAMRKARRAGLRVMRMGNRAFVAGDELIAFLKSQDGASE